MLPDDDTCYTALLARDSRFDGRFYVGVLTTGIYCRPVCPARTPHRRNVRFFASAAGAAASGLRACRRCRPDTIPGSREWDARGDLAARALRLIAAGVIDDEGVAGLAVRLHVTSRHLHRVLVHEVGAAPLQIARTRRAQTARLLIGQTTMPMTEIAFASGFSSLRQFNDVMAAEFGVAPSQLRRVATDDGRVPGAGTVTVRLAFRPPYDTATTLDWLSRHSVPGLESVAGRTVSTMFDNADPVQCTIGEREVSASIGLDDVRALPHHVAALRSWLDLDAQPAAVAESLSADPYLAPRVAQRPGIRVPGTVDPFRAAWGAVLAQQVGTAAAGRAAARLATAVTEGLRFPRPAEVAAVDPDDLAARAGLPAARARTVVALARAVEQGDILQPHADRAETRTALLRVPGVGPWTAAVIALRSLRDPDVWPAGDLVLDRTVLGWGGADPAAWSPWRSYAAHHVWADAAARPVMKEET